MCNNVVCDRSETNSQFVFVYYSEVKSLALLTKLKSEWSLEKKMREICEV